MVRRMAPEGERWEEDRKSWGQTKVKSAVQWEVKTEKLGFRRKFCLVKLQPSPPAEQMAGTGLRRKGKVFAFHSGQLTCPG